MDFETVVVGGGIIGLAVADAKAQLGSDTLLIERHARLGQETTSRNSEVVHAGLYYPKGSLKARLCIEGRDLLHAFCSEAGVPYLRLGKLVVACAQDEVPALEALAARAKANGAADVALISSDVAQELEPQLYCHAALLSPSTAVIDSIGLMLALEARFIDSGGTIATGTNVVAVERRSRGFSIVTVSHGCESAITCSNLVLAAGLSASALANRIAPPLAMQMPLTRFAKGHYYALTGPQPFARLVYPMPSTAGLGIHYTLSAAGEAKFGPDVEWCDDPSPVFDDPNGARRRAFAVAIRTYWPAVDEEKLTPSYVGVRPKIAGKGEPAADFAIFGPEVHSCDGLIALFGIESPGLTSSLAIGRLVASMLEDFTA